MTQPTVLLDVKDGIALITLNRPEAANALTTTMAEELEALCQRISQDGSLRAVILTGAGDRAFCSGGDLKEFAERMQASPSPGELESLGPHNAVRALASLKLPLIAAINGPALGLGLALALACDLRLASQNASFGTPDVSHGFIPLSGITQRLPRLVGRGKALEMLLTAQTVEAQEAYRLGLVNKVVPPADLLPEAEAWARKLATKAPISLRFAREAVSQGMDLTLEQGLRLEADLYFLLFSTRDRTEGVTAFQQKRPAHFAGE